MGLGTAEGVSALSIQGVADAAGVSKALVLYHFESKAVLLTALTDLLGERDASSLGAAARAGDASAAFRELVETGCASREPVLLAALSLERSVGTDVFDRVRVERERAAAQLAIRLLRDAGLGPRVPAAFLGRMLVRELDGLALAMARGAAADALSAERDAVLLTILAQGR